MLDKQGFITPGFFLLFAREGEPVVYHIGKDPGLEITS